MSRPDASGNDFRTVAKAALVNTPSAMTSTTAVKIGQRLMRRTVKLYVRSYRYFPQETLAK
jgi:hypothetical protein